MGSGIAQVAATAGHPTIIYDTNSAALDKAKANLSNSLNKLVEKQKSPQKKRNILSLTRPTLALFKILNHVI
ncbi:MAG: hypothetical protein IPL10_09155 [Bacteroidetes bacterium]|nr:hypothetical protein [Bacteroidota bacterium]